MIPASSYIGLRILMNILYRLHDYIELKFIPVFKKDITLTTLDYIRQHSHAYFQKNHGGSIVTRITELANGAQALVESIIKNFFPNVVALLIACFTMGTVNLTLGFILLAWAILFIVGTYYLSKEPYQLAQELSKRNVSFSSKLLDSITNMMAVRLFARNHFEKQYLMTRAKKKMEAAQELRWSTLKRQALMETASNVLIGSLIFYLIYARQKSQVTVGDFALILSLAISIIDAMWDISRDFLEFTEHLGQCSQTLSTIAVPHEIIDKVDAKTLQIKQGAIEWRAISFKYNKKPIFQELSLKVPAGQKVGLVGYSGSGKTTFINLITRLFDIHAGEILIDGQNIANVAQESLYESISYIPQEPLLFNRDIFQNIAYGKYTASEEEIIEAAKKANAHDFITELPQGYYTRIGENGVMLSGGQKQRLAIARALLKNSKILILDEATSALDSVTEHLIQQSLQEIMKNKTVLAVAHRLSTLMNMDRILVFDNGKIIEDGTHQELLSKNSVYAKLWHLQAGEFLL